MKIDDRFTCFLKSFTTKVARMAQWLRAPVDLVEDSGSVHSTHMEPMPPVPERYIYTYRQNTHRDKIFLKKN